MGGIEKRDECKMLSNGGRGGLARFSSGLCSSPSSLATEVYVGGGGVLRVAASRCPLATAHVAFGLRILIKHGKKCER